MPDAKSPHWFSQTLGICKQIEDAVQAQGRGFWFIETEEGNINAVSLLRADSGTLYLTAMNHSIRLPVRIIKSLVKDREAQKHWEEIEGTMEKESFVDAWSKQGTTYRVQREWG
jgi:hypothetical protein